MTSTAKPLLESRRFLAGVLFVDAVLLLVFALMADDRRPPWSAVLLVHMGFLSLATLAVFAIDRFFASRDKRRVFEANLLLLSFAGGALGGLLGILMLRHKSQHWRFRVFVPTALIPQLVLLVYLVLRRL